MDKEEWPSALGVRGALRGRLGGRFAPPPAPPPPPPPSSCWCATWPPRTRGLRLPGVRLRPPPPGKAAAAARGVLARVGAGRSPTGNWARPARPLSIALRGLLAALVGLEDDRRDEQALGVRRSPPPADTAGIPSEPPRSIDANMLCISFCIRRPLGSGIHESSSPTALKLDAVGRPTPSKMREEAAEDKLCHDPRNAKGGT